MIRIIYGKKGMGKTKVLVDTANSLANESKGQIVFIDYSNQLMYDLKHEVRFINVSEFPVTDASAFLGFICGIISENYDVEAIFIDRLTYIVKQQAGELKEFFEGLKKLEEKSGARFYMSINSEEGTVPEFIREYL